MKRTSENRSAKPRGTILRVKQGYNPNSSSIGSIVFILPAALLAIPALFGAVSGLVLSTFVRTENPTGQRGDRRSDKRGNQS